jgi:hypothetical protein
MVRKDGISCKNCPLTRFLGATVRFGKGEGSADAFRADWEAGQVETVASVLAVPL